MVLYINNAIRRGFAIFVDKQIFENMVKMRRDLHMIPETALEEIKTAEYICQRLDSLGVEYKKGVAKTGVVGLIRGKDGDKTLLLRADIDALPVTEVRNLPYKSKHEGFMHACGHDFHMSALLGAAEVLNGMRDCFSGNIKLIFQPAEEGVGGAEPMIKEGVLENPAVTAAAALHVWPELLSGKVELKEGGMTAAPDEFDITIRGKSGHAAYPSECISPLIIAGRVCDEITKLTDINKERLVSVTQLSGGNCYNVIPETAHIGGTDRSTTPETRAELERLITEITERECEKMGGECEILFRRMYPPVVNDKKLTEMFKASAARAVGKDNVLNVEKVSMIGEDFSYFGEKVPAVFAHLGAKPHDAKEVYPLHNALVNFDENCLKTACECLVTFALDYLKEER